MNDIDIVRCLMKEGRCEIYFLSSFFRLYSGPSSCAEDCSTPLSIKSQQPARKVLWSRAAIGGGV